MTTILTVNIIAFTLAVIAILFLGFLLLRSERKLAKWDESWVFRKRGGKK